MKQLHLSNIANMAYGYSKLLRNAKCEASVLCYDLDRSPSPQTEIGFSHAEWYDSDLTEGAEPAVAASNLDPAPGNELRATAIPDWYQKIRSKDYWPVFSAANPPWDLDDE